VSEVEEKPTTRRRRSRPTAPDGDVLFLGDLCFGASYGRSSFEKRGFDSPFERIDALLQRASYVVANLETTLTTLETSPLEGKKRYLHKDDPEGAEALKRHAIQAVSLANNHAFDYGSVGLAQTLESLGASGIKAIGAGPSAADIDHTLVHDLALERGTFPLAVTVGKENVDYDYPYYVGENQAGIVGWTRQSAAAQIRVLREAEPEAFIVAYPHWGTNYRWKDRDQRKLARSMIRAGADLIVGHGAHCMQEIEFVEGRWVVYSIGNSVFNTPGSFGRRPKILPYSFIARLCVRERRHKRDIALRLYPILSDNRRTKFRPRFVMREEMAIIKEQLITRCSESEQLESELKRGKDEFGRYLRLRLGSQ
jgi:poly-gamma-glutamate capsule biosynthesis protein CapA/YwtB (metallophosphatase superfamily)